MKLRTLAMTALAGGALALTAAAPALADATGGDPSASPSASPAPNGTIAVSATFDTKVAYAGDTVTLTVTSRQSSTANAAGSFALYWTGPISYLGHGNAGTCKASESAHGSYVYCPETTDQRLVTDTFRFTVDGPLAHNVVTKMQVKASSGEHSARTTAALNTCVDVSPSPSASQSASESPSASPSDEPTSASPSASPSPSGSASESPSTQPSVTLAAGGSGGLPVTGASLGLIGGAAAVLLAAGAVLTLSARRRRNHS
ncbi:hypothetical protein Athai_40530 [Actinocatenispora thailandica]|uniref:Gram-positive cocci surface proteins LPxTG domain-containing protein n=1 Tax=Actinocatenispora thailandica TaxID=227318 RepID=A0A7R7DRI1_9ACTN|nr:hypothetical protein [Actinocatenispora thailandica]BCJ36550.1 hypothetical protein Athai_40530 [Actinocatenispora thailandica]